MYFLVGYGFVCGSLTFFVHESTKFYHSRGRFDDVRSVLNKIARTNKVNYISNALFAEEIEH